MPMSDAKTEREMATEIVVAWLGGSKSAEHLVSGMTKGDSFSQVGKKIGEVFTEVLKAIRQP